MLYNIKYFKVISDSGGYPLPLIVINSMKSTYHEIVLCNKLFRNSLLYQIFLFRHTVKSLLVRPGRIYRERTNLMGLYSRELLNWGREEAYVREERYFNLQSVKFIHFLFFSRFCNKKQLRMERITFI